MFVCSFSSRPVKVIRLVGRDTVEEVILRRADMKLKLTNKVVEGGQFSSIANANNTAVNATQVCSLLVPHMCVKMRR